eukprot:5533434-Prymnesium_polylepis.1
MPDSDLRVHAPYAEQRTHANDGGYPPDPTPHSAYLFCTASANRPSRPLKCAKYAVPPLRATPREFLKHRVRVDEEGSSGRGVHLRQPSRPLLACNMLSG